MTLVDSHCHLDFPDFAEELDEVVARAGRAGIGAMLTICTKMSKADQVRQIAERFPNIYASVGVHPHEAEEEGLDAPDVLIARAAHPKIIGIGETGLDYFYEHSPREKQQVSFRAHIEASRQTGLPLIVHTRDAEEDTAKILTEEMGQGAFPVIIHCFSSSQWLADACLEIGAYLSLSGILTFKKATELRATAASAPLDKLLVETDAPYLAPVPNRGKRNEPSYVFHTAQCLAELRGQTIDEISAATTANFYKIFSKAAA